MTDLHTVPTPLDARPVNLRDDVENVHAAAAVAVPVLDVPARKDEPRTGAEPKPHTVRVHLADIGGHVDIAAAIRWRACEDGRLDVYGQVDNEGSIGKLRTQPAGTWIAVERLVETTGADA